MDPEGKWLFTANQATNEVVVFRVDQQTGELSPTGTKVQIPSPMCVRFLKK